MAPVASIVSCVRSLEENPRDVYLQVSSVLLTLANNVIEHPTNPKYRTVRLANPTIANKLVPAIGAMECLFEMGFEEADDSLVLSERTSLHNINVARDEILKRRKHILSDQTSTSLVNPPKSATPETQPPAKTSSSSSILRKPQTLTERPRHSLIETIEKYSTSVQQYEDKSLQREALACIPLAQLEIGAEQRLRAVQKAIKKLGDGEKPPEPSTEQLLLLELMNWFKNSFFKWVDKPACTYCSNETENAGTNQSQEFLIDVYKCKSCFKETLFPRYSDARKLLETRRGRCGEWANCFTLFCRSLGYDARLVLDITDHVWTEVFLPSFGRWVHFDSCENAFDQPLLYELGWKKQLSYIIAFSHDDIQDVSWRYSARHADLRNRRRACKESELLDVILKVREKLQQNSSPARKAYLQNRTLQELIELLKEPEADNKNYSGRQSGSLLWRLARGEISDDSFSGPYVWKPNKAEIQKQFMHIQYCTSSDYYTRPVSGETLKGWQNGAFSVESVFRKEEKDWKMVYLARAEGSEKGQIQWKMDFQETGLVVDTITVVLNKFTCENGAVLSLLCGDTSCLLVGGSELTTNALAGEESITLKVELSGGRGDIAWQQAQILRSSCENEAATLDIKVKLKPRLNVHMGSK